MLSKRLTIRALALPVLAAAFCGSLRAAELGEVKVNSHIGQQLSADIELVDLTAADLADIQARLANPDVFKGANVAMPPALGGMYISIARRDNKRFLHLTTLQPVNADALHLFLELNSGGRQVIRAASLWLTPEPPGQRAANGTAMPAAEPMPAAPMPAATSQPSPGSGEAGLSEAAQRAFAHRRQVAMAKALEQSTDAARQGAPAADPKPEARREPEVMVPPRKPSTNLAAVVATTSPPPIAAPGQVAAPSAPPKTSAKPAAATVTASAPATAPPAAGQAPSCAPAKEVEAQLHQCEAMTSKLADIEGKVQRLQTSIVAPAAAVASASAAAPATATAPKAEVTPAKPGPAPAKPGAMPVKPGVAADLAANPRRRLLMIAGGVLGGLAALGGLIYFLRKRQAKGPLKIWQSFRKKGKSEDEVPTLEDAVEVAAH